MYCKLKFKFTPMQDLWFAAAVPPGKIIEKVEIHRQYAAQHFNARKALNSPPHITLFPPFRCTQSAVDDLSIILAEVLKRFDAFELSIQNFSSFKPRVIFLNVKESENLRLLQSALDHLLRWQFRLIEMPDTREFKPHVTIAHRDLDRKLFKSAWQHFQSKSFEESFVLRRIVLFRHDGKQWQAYKNYELKA